MPQRLAPFFPAIARFAIAAKGSLNATGKPFIDENLACPNLPCGAMGGVNIGFENTADMAIVCAIGNLDGLCLRGGFQDGKHWPEHLCLGAWGAAAALTDTAPPSRQAPWFWSEQFDARLKSAGIIPPARNGVQ